VDDFALWCDRAFLQLNVEKTKDMQIDFRRESSNPQSTIINGKTVEFVETYKYLGSFIGNKLNFNANTEMLCKRGQQRLFCLCKFSKFRLDKTLMTLFLKSYIESVLTFSLICWYGSLTVKAKTALSNIVKVTILT